MGDAPVWVPMLVLAATVLLLFRRPAGLGEGGAALLGAVAMVASGWAAPADAWEGARATAGVMVFLAGMMVVAAVADTLGVFDWAAWWAIRAAGGRGRLLYVYLYALGAVITLFLSLDVTAIVFTPIVCTCALRLGLRPAPFVFASAFVANTASLALPVSNLTNMLVYDLLGLGFWSFTRYLAAPNLAALAINLGLFLFLFRAEIPDRFAIQTGAPPPLPRAAGLGIVAIVAGLLAAGFGGWPLWAVAALGAAAFALGGLGSRRVAPATIAGSVAWQLPLFVVGMYVVVLGSHRAVLAPLWSEALQQAGASGGLGLVAIAFASGVGANVVNNIPMSLVAISGLGALTAGREELALATVIGTNLGPNLTIFGSLATMLVLDSARRKGVVIGAGQYLKVGLLTTPPMIAAAALLLGAGLG
ncbi:MAG: ArsB/NhaD family transporter [Chloroflexota bacterium]